jgi:hypothetical protein
MTRQIKLLGIVFLLSLGFGCAKPTVTPTGLPKNVFKMPQNEFYEKIKTIALSPLTIPENFPNKESSKLSIESLLEAKLIQAGFSIISSRVVEDIRKRMAEQVGGYVDTVTGKLNKPKFEAVRDHSRQELSFKFKVDAILYSNLQAVNARLSEGFAWWDGVSEPIAYGYRGSIKALSLLVVIQDMNGVELYVKRGGFQVLEKIAWRTVIPVPQDELLTREERKATSVNVALGSLLKRPEPNIKPSK